MQLPSSFYTNARKLSKFSQHDPLQLTASKVKLLGKIVDECKQFELDFLHELSLKVMATNDTEHLGKLIASFIENEPMSESFAKDCFDEPFLESVLCGIVEFFTTDDTATTH